MTYSKPEVTNTTEAQAAIQHNSEKGSMYVDGIPDLPNTAVSPAYEADE